MRTVLLSILIAALSATAHADCRHPNGNIQTDAYHAPCADVLNDPRNTMCCAIERPNPSGGLAKNGYAADTCLPNGLCKQDWKDAEDSALQTHYYREECTVAGWKSGKCLSVCLSVSASSNVRMTPCDGTANSTRWCCGDNKDCCAGDIGFESLAQIFLGDLSSATTVSSSSVAVAASSSTAVASLSTSSTSGTSTSSTSTSSTSTSSTSAPQTEEASTSLSGGAIAGIVVGAIAGIALIGAAWFLLARRRRPSEDPAPPMYVEAGYQTDAQKTSYAHEADGAEPQVAEVSAANVKDHDGRSRVHELQ